MKLQWSEELNELTSLTAMDELVCRTTKQFAFEGIALSVIYGQNKEDTRINKKRRSTTERRVEGHDQRR